MKRPEPMKNLWIVSLPASSRRVTHTARLPNREFVPIYSRLNPLMRQANPELSRSGASPVSC